MSNSNSRMIVFASILGAILATSILALNPSTITNAAAQMYGDQYGYDNNHQKKSYTDIQKIKCVNSNINVNGIDITQIPQDGAATAAANEGGQEGANTQNGNGLADRINFDRNLVNVCANVNDNEQVKITPLPEEEEDLGCEECFAEHPELKAAIEELLATLDFGDFAFIAIGPPITAPGEEEVFVITFATDTIEQLCAIIQNSEEETGVILSDDFLRLVLSSILGSGFESEIDALIECLLEKGIIVDRDFDPTSISNNGIDSGSIPNVKVECIGDNPICQRILQ